MGAIGGIIASGMKSPQELADKLARQWLDTDLRETRLLLPASAFPISLPIGKPSPSLVASDLMRVKQHIEAWKAVSVGHIRFEEIAYRATAGGVEMPIAWEIRNPDEWIQASASQTLRNEFTHLSAIIVETHEQFHRILIRQRFLSRGTAVAEVVQASKLALALEPGCARGKPLRTLSLEGIDTKFFERNQRLITALLDVRFDGEAGEAGLISFLDAAPEGEHWLLVVDLDGSQLPFRRLRITSQELQSTELPADRVIIVENERCLHQLPETPNTIAVLGCGDLTWTQATWLQDKRVAYWGDIDTWGLALLAKARTNIPNLLPLLMTEAVFKSHRESSVPEPVHANPAQSPYLTQGEQSLFHLLLTEDRGRLEQEFLPIPLVHKAILDWAKQD